MPDLFDFPEIISRLQSPAAVCTELLARTGPMGFTIYAIGGMPHPQTPYPTEFFFSNWPEVWQRAYFERCFGDNDPTLRAMGMGGQAFTISDLRRGKLGFTPSTKENEMLDFADSIGVPNGFLLPIFRAHGYRGMSCVAGIGPDPDAATRARLHFLLDHAHDRLRVLGAQHPINAQGVELTPREVQILTLARQGMADAAISAATGITIRTVRFHFENARHKLAARSRAEAIAIAVGRHLLPG